MLSRYRVLDLSDDGCLLCGQILADLGADVIQIEPPEGARARRQGPFRGPDRDPEKSLVWWAYARNKRSRVLDLERDEDRATLHALAREADFLIESGAPGKLASLGLGYTDLAEENPGLIYVSISGFGQEGPKADWASTDLTLLAAAGPLVLTGDDDRPPVRLSVPQAFPHAAAEAAVGALIAHHEREHSGRGQHVDVAVQQALTAATQSDLLSAAVGDVPVTRTAGGIKVGPAKLRLVFPAADGHVSITHVFGSAIGPATRRLMEWVHDEGFCDAATRDKDWIGYTELVLMGEEPLEEFERVKQTIAACTGSKKKTELLEIALERGLLMSPITTVRDVVESEQLSERKYFTAIETDGETVRYPGPFARFGATPLRYRRGVPRLNEHARADWEAPGREAAASAREAAASAREAAASASKTEAELPLAGVKVVDFMWALAGPGATRTLADYGATVVRIESTSRLDVCRTLRPYRNQVPGPENSALFHSTNAGKRMITLDPTKPEGREVVLDLVRWADVVTESFSPKGMKGFGLDYETLREVNPDLIMLSTCLMGQTGPLARFAGFGNLAAAICGFYELTGWPDRDPAGPFGAYTDYIAPRYNAAAVLAALDFRNRTGQGQHIDLSQAEAALHFLGPALLDYTANGNVPSRMGNRDRELAPHGVYPAAGEDCWVAIAVRDDEEWRSLSQVLEQPALADDPRFATADARLAHLEALDALMVAYTEKRDRYEVESALQAAGIPASVVQNSPELVADPQLRARDHFVELDHPEGGVTVVEGSRIRLSRTPAQIRGPAPTFGCDNEYVLKGILGYDDERIAEIVIAGALE